MSIPRTVLHIVVLSAVILALTGAVPSPRALADGKLVPPRDYPGSLEERAQEAIIIFHGAKGEKPAVEDLILKLSVKGARQPETLKSFGWVVPFPRPPRVHKEDARLFRECFDYVQAQQVPATRSKNRTLGKAADGAERKGVKVIQRKVVGSYDVAVVRETEAGALNRWLETEGFQTLADGEDVIAFYRKKGYVFACLKVSDAALAADRVVDLHPVRFTFATGGRDGIYFPMKMTGLQKEPFDVNLYVFYGAWLNDRLNRYGFVHRGFSLRFRDWDSPACRPNQGKAWSSPENDPYLKRIASRIPTLARLFQKLHPGARYYLTNLQAYGLEPEEVRQWSDDLWLFPYYVDENVVPYDARPGGPAAAAWKSD